MPLLYVDLDGTVRHGFDELGRFVNGPDDVVVWPEAVEQLHRWRDQGGRVIGVSNQGGIALGFVSEADCAAAMAKTQELCGDVFDLMCWCPHHPQATTMEGRRCWCRKPRAGMAIEATVQLGWRFADEQYERHLSLFVGDRGEDRMCADALDVDFQEAASWRSGMWRMPEVR